MRIAVDAMGGDLAPGEIVRGVVAAAPRLSAEISLVGREEILHQLLQESGSRPGNVEVHPAAQVIGMTESPVQALRQKRDASMAVAMELVRSGQADAVISAGNTGALMALGKLRLRMLPGVDRPAIAAPIPTRQGGPVLLLDAGANVECKPQQLAQFALMASAYMEDVLGCEQPRVGLLNIGSEAYKGNGVTKEAHELISALDLNFVGYVEGDQLFEGDVDVIVCDGFVGNVALKVAEGLGDLILELFGQEVQASSRGKLGAMLMRPIFRSIKQQLDYREYGGALLLGVNGVCVKSHGRSDAKAIGNALSVAVKAVENDFIAHLADSCSHN